MNHLAVFFAVLALVACGQNSHSGDTAESETQSYFANRGLLATTTPSVCWYFEAGDPLTVPNQKIMTSIQQTVAAWGQSSALKFNFVGLCPAPLETSISSIYQNDIRIRLISAWDNKEVGKPIPGRNCPNVFPNAPLWANYPSTYARSCKYTAQVMTNQPINNYLHEFGHAIGLFHEHERSDATCVPAGTFTDPSGTPITRTPDTASVMYYVMNTPTCQIPGNFGTGGLSNGDRLAAEMMYPVGCTRGADGFDHCTAKVTGERVIKYGQPLFLRLEWNDRGAFIQPTGPSMVRALSWQFDGASAGGTPVMTRTGLTIGAHTAKVSYLDNWNRIYQATIGVRVDPPTIGPPN